MRKVSQILSVSLVSLISISAWAAAYTEGAGLSEGYSQPAGATATNELQKELSQEELQQQIQRKNTQEALQNEQQIMNR